MPFVKNTSYRYMPFSPESPSPDDFHCFVSVKQLEQMKYHRNTYRCRTVGVVSCDFGKFVIHELDDSSIQIRLSLAHWYHLPPFTGKPYAAQVFGLVYWKDGLGPVILPFVIQSIPPAIAFQLRDTLLWLNQAHVASATSFESEKKEE